MEPIFRAQALSDGISDERLRTAVSRRELVRVRNGAYVPTAVFGDLYAEEKHRVAALAAIPRLHQDSVLSHISAAVFHGLPLWRTDIARVHVTRPGITTRATTRVRFFGQPLEPDDIESIRGVRVTSLDRTLVDVVRTLPFEQAVVVGDAALRKGAQVPATLDRRRGNEQARLTLAFLNGRSESPGESRSRVLMDRKSIVKPLLQVTILDHHGRFIARVDFCWPEFGVIGEFDGMLKYKANKGEDSSEVVALEKRREDKLRAAGWNVVRWVWDDLDEPDRMLDDLRRHLIRQVAAPSMWRL